MFKLEKFFYINSIQELDFTYIKKSGANLIIRNVKKEDFIRCLKIKEECFKRNITLYVSNDVKLLFKLNLKNLYISSYNKKYYKNLSSKIKIIGSAHNLREIIEKENQGCKLIIFSRLFKTYKKNYWGVIRFNLISYNKDNIIALGGINSNNYRKLSMVNCKGVGVMSDLSNKPKF